MNEGYWIKYGFKENGDLVCVRLISDSKPGDLFFYTENGKYKEVKNPNTIKLTKKVMEKLEIIDKLNDYEE